MKDSEKKEKPGKAKRTAAQSREESREYLEALREYGKGIEHFQRQNYQEAENHFVTLKQKYADDIEIVERANIYLKICQNLKKKTEAPLKTSNDCYQMGVIRCNEQRYDEAISLFEKALQKDGAEPEKIHYVMACTYAESENAEKAVESFKKAIELNENNKNYAVNSNSFAKIRNNPLFQDLLRPSQKKGRSK
jgi:tetratricopeptide (TPR) repeat protein